ncbi:hypothetical protein ETI06_05675 [Macrococcoides goetzii]|nr:hypothetical protein [Macrococcus goetzii]TDM49962.1 hypothetical protein ETI06_05675 [Macrococcus goetzii]
MKSIKEIVLESSNEVNNHFLETQVAKETIEKHSNNGTVNYATAGVAASFEISQQYSLELVNKVLTEMESEGYFTTK